MDIKLYCLKSFTGSALRTRLEEMLEENSLPYHVLEINDPDEFIKDGVHSVPSIKVMNALISHNETSEIESTIQRVKEALQNYCEKYIVVPMDFTPESMHALRYAMMMASKLDKGITLVHIHEPLVDPITNTAFDVEMMKQNRYRLDEMLIEAGWDKFKYGSHIPVDIKFEAGDAASNIVEIMEDEKYDFIIMSTKAENTFYKRLLSSVSKDVSMESLKPVIIIPPDAEAKFPRKVQVGLADELLEGTALNFLLDFACDNDVFLDFVHISDDNETFERIKNTLHDRISSYNEEFKTFNIVLTNQKDDNVEESLLKRAKEQEHDMLVVMTHHRNFINSIGHRSISKGVLLQPHLPVMILHGEDEKGLGIVDYLYELIREG